MSALPSPLHSKATRRPAKLDKYGRDPASVPERARASSDYDKGTGYAPFYHAFMADLPRLSSGQACTWLILTALSKSLGRGAKKGEPRPETTGPLAIADLAALCRCDERTIERELAGLKARKIATVTAKGKGLVAIELLYRDWQALPDYKSNVVDIATGQEPEEPADEDKAKEATRVELTKRPQTTRAGKSSRSIPVTCGVKAFRFQNDSVVDLSFTAVVQAGELILSSKATEQWVKKAQKQATCQTNGSRNLQASTPTPMSGKKRTSGESESKAKERTSGESAADYCKIHPRAQEICNLFDPILLKSQARLLSADSKALSEACGALGECDHDYLVKFVMTRAKRPINSPTHVRLIVQEAAQNWAASKTMPTAEKFPPKKEISPAIKAMRERLARTPVR